MRDRFVPPSCRRELRNKLMRLEQGDKSVQDYYADLQKGLQRCGIVEVSAFRPRGVPGPMSKLSLRVPAQMGRREMEHKGEKGTAARVILRPGRMRLQ
jgi:hypothetical protein